MFLWKTSATSHILVNFEGNGFFTGDSHLRKVDREIYSTWKCPNVRISTLLFDSLPYLKRYIFFLQKFLAVTKIFNRAA